MGQSGSGFNLFKPAWDVFLDVLHDNFLLGLVPRLSILRVRVRLAVFIHLLLELRDVLRD